MSAQTDQTKLIKSSEVRRIWHCGWVIIIIFLSFSFCFLICNEKTFVTCSINDLVPLVQSLWACLAVPNPSWWLIRMIRLSYAIQLAWCPPKFIGILFTLVRGENTTVLHVAINRTCPSGRDEARVLQSLLHHTKEGLWELVLLSTSPPSLITLRKDLLSQGQGMKWQW